MRISARPIFATPSRNRNTPIHERVAAAANDGIAEDIVRLIPQRAAWRRKSIISFPSDYVR
jgi:hypothetical protein